MLGRYDYYYEALALNNRIRFLNSCTLLYIRLQDSQTQPNNFLARTFQIIL